MGKMVVMSWNSGRPPCILIADDQKDILSSGRMLFRSEGIDCITAESPREVIERLKLEPVDLLLLDLNYQRDTTSGQEGMDLIQAVRKLDPVTPIVVMTAWASIEIAVEAMKRGANDFITKPWEIERLLSIVRTQSALKRSLEKSNKLESENRILRQEASVQLLYRSQAVRDIVETFEQIAPSDANVLLTGENGTGKTLFAKYCHQLSARRDKAFISVNVGGLPESLFESELFGHVKGAFTDAKADRIGRYELADGGTLFLDEIGNLCLKHQATLLRLLESGEFERLGSSKTRRAEVRLICATNANLQEQVRNGTFREDLYFRINTVPIHVPPLRQRVEDIPLLAGDFLEQFRLKYRKADLAFSAAAARQLERYPWPGNVRELAHAVERAVLLAKGSAIEPTDLGICGNTPLVAPSPMDDPHDLNLDAMEKRFLQQAMLKFPGDPNEAANALGLTRSSFYRRLHKHGIPI
jgi:DNA-binding NtrC family response regulator